jgi:hypothetical protein
MLGGLGAPLIGVPLPMASCFANPAKALATPAPPKTFYLSQYGAYDDGAKPYTTEINNAYRAAAAVGGTVVWDITYGLGYKIASPGITIPSGTRTVGAGCNLDRANTKLEGAFLFPANSTWNGGTGLAGLLNLSVPGTSVRGLGFRGTTSGGSNVSNLVGVMVNGMKDIMVMDCVALKIGERADPKNGGGGAFYWYQSINARCYRCAAFHCGFGVQIDGQGATDGKIDQFQANDCHTSISLGPSDSTDGGVALYLGPGVHLWGGALTHYHLNASSKVHAIRCVGVYFGPAMSGQPLLNFAGYGLQCVNCYFAPTNGADCAIKLPNTGSYAYAPDSSIIGCRMNAGTATVRGFVELGISSGNPYALIFRGNTATTGTGTAISGWTGHVLRLGSGGSACEGSTNGTPDFAAVNQTAW